MGACPNLFYLIYQHTAFPFTWELSAVTLVSASTLLLMLMRPEVWRGTSPCFISVLITEYTIMQYYPSTSRKVLRLHSNRETNEGSDSRLQSISYSHFTHLVPSISIFFFFLPESPRISSLQTISRPDQMIFRLMVSHNVIFQGLKNPRLFKGTVNIL